MTARKLDETAHVTMTPEQVELARHALGLPNDRKVSYRNRFVAGTEHGDYDDWMAMVAAGDAEQHIFSQHPSVRFVFTLTLQGARAALRKGESLDAEDFPA